MEHFCIRSLHFRKSHSISDLYDFLFPPTIFTADIIELGPTLQATDAPKELNQ